MGALFVVEHDLAHRIVAHILFFGDGKFEPFGLALAPG
jgi:hypothetical protein